MNYIFHILVMINIYTVLALSLNLLVGYAGLLSICHAAFYGLGAYISTLLMMKAGLGFLPAMACGVLGAVLISFIVSLPSLRLKGDYFIIATLGFQIIVYSILYNWIDVTRGPYGIPGIPRPVVFGYQVTEIPQYVVLTGIFAVLVLVLFWRICHSPFGLVLKTIREDELVAQSLGKPVARQKIVAFAIAGGIAAISGTLYATYVTYIDPTSFTVDESIFILSAIILGGTGNIRGSLVGVVFVLVLPELLRFLNIPDSIAPNARQMIYGLMLILLMRFRPQGLWGDYAFE